MGKRKVIVSDDDLSSHSTDQASDNSPDEFLPLSKSKSSDKPSSTRNPRKITNPSDNDLPTVKKPRIHSTVHRSTDGESYIELGKKRRVTIRSFKGSPLIDIREYYPSEGVEKPGKKGISLTVEQWNIIKSNIAVIDKLLSDLKE
ncbi:hypothetical protein AMATHDRAFT_2951 [Amanita thiersii Skay4041]|uniref:Transcriptional coactivator p15 (PC4) C-terminal domain-containing protein n=1 Tax=Amanita thiersii Skay4041 TaxID=703135 RepID=A0A2A9NQ96_9AGAR|nr:hypothetical protein AMATHDRAFT_2951 [Amanita thiersii Skay4041]